MVECIDAFNQRLSELNAAYRLMDNSDNVADNYNMYIASKKTGLPKDDYPGK
jgi:hypothetical protein